MVDHPLAPWRDHLLPGTEPILCTSVDDALAEIQRIYQTNVANVRQAYHDLVQHDRLPTNHSFEQAGHYPFLGIHVESHQLNVDALKAFGAVHEAGFYGTTLTQPDLFADYYREQIALLIQHHEIPVVVGTSTVPIPLPYVVETADIAFEPEKFQKMSQVFILPNLSTIDDAVANGTYDASANVLRPLSLFKADRVDLSLHRLHHYTGTSAQHFQRYILLTNYQRYIHEFVGFAKAHLKAEGPDVALVAPGDCITTRNANGQLVSTGEAPQYLPQMPAYHLVRPDRSGITFINIGVGPSNAKTITDHLAVLRPDCWIMLGHCAGLRRGQHLGDYVLAHAYVREDNVMADDVPTWVPIPPIAEVQVALQDAVARVTGLARHTLKTRMRTGTVVTTDNRNWEFRSKLLYERFQQSRAIAIDMESATMAANGFRFRVPYGTLLCVSDKPIHGEIKLRGMANTFYQERIAQHLDIGLAAIQILRDDYGEQLHSRKLRGFDDPPFR